MYKDYVNAMIMNIPFFQNHTTHTHTKKKLAQSKNRWWIQHESIPIKTGNYFTERWWEEEGNEPSLICRWEKYHMMIPPSQPLLCKWMEGAKHSSLAVYYSTNAACLTGHPDAWQQPKKHNKFTSELHEIFTAHLRCHLLFLSSCLQHWTYSTITFPPFC